jgi:hypothetical protein
MDGMDRMDGGMDGVDEESRGKAIVFYESSVRMRPATGEWADSSCAGIRIGV